MIEQHAVILDIDSDAEIGSVATIEVVRKTACGLCGQKRGCGNAFWGKLFAHKPASLKAQNTIDAKVGQSVVVGIEEHAVMKGALFFYLLPLVTMMIAAILVSWVASSEAVTMLGAAVGLLIGYLWAKAHTAGRAYYKQHQPKILRLDTTISEEHSIKFQ